MKEASDHEKDGVERTVASSDPPDKDASEEAPTIIGAKLHAHSKSMLHRDLKPSNIVIQNEGSNELAKIIDFGIAKSLEADAAAFTASFQNMGTPQYMSPEQCQARKLDARSDLYSFGCLMYEVLAGRPPFSSGDSLQTMFAHVNTDPEPLSKIAPEAEVPAHLESAIAKAMQKNPDDRFQSASELKKHILGDVSPLATERSNSEAHLPSESSRRKSQSNSEHKSLIRKAMIPGMVIVTVVVIAVLMMADRDNVMLIIDGRRLVKFTMVMMPERFAGNCKRLPTHKCMPSTWGRPMTPREARTTTKPLWDTPRCV